MATVNSLIRWIEVPGREKSSFIWNQVKTGVSGEYDSEDFDSAGLPKVQVAKIVPSIKAVNDLLRDLYNRAIIRWHYDAVAGTVMLYYRDTDAIEHSRETDDSKIVLLAHDVLSAIAGVVTTKNSTVSAGTPNV